MMYAFLFNIQFNCFLSFSIYFINQMQENVISALLICQELSLEEIDWCIWYCCMVVYIIISSLILFYILGSKKIKLINEKSINCFFSDALFDKVQEQSNKLTFCEPFPQKCVITSLKDKLELILNHKAFSDVSIVYAGRKIDCHKCILSMFLAYHFRW